MRILRLSRERNKRNVRENKKIKKSNNLEEKSKSYKT